MCFGGGSKTTVQQQAANSTDVNVTTEIQNVINTEALAAAVAYVGSLVEKTGDESKKLIAQIAQGQLITTLIDAKAKIDQNELIKKGFKFAGIGAVLWFLWRKFLK